MKTAPDIHKELANYFAGDLSNEEANDLKTRILNDVQHEVKFNQMNQVWQLEVCDQNISSRIQKRTILKISKWNLLNARFKFFRVAAVALLFIGLSFAAYFGGQHYPLSEKEYTCEAGRIEHFNLADGTEVWLNSKSKINYTRYLWRKDRNVSLLGEAYFYVAADAKHPFIVHTPEVDIQVTGTKFSVSAYTDDAYINTYLEEGSVTFIDKLSQSKHKLKPDQLVYLDKKSSEFKIISQPDMKIGSWRNGELNFYDEPLNSIGRKLERKFDIQIVFANEQIQQLRYTAEFEKESLDQILRFLKIASALEIEQKEKTYIISLKNKELLMD